MPGPAPPCPRTEKSKPLSTSLQLPSPTLGTPRLKTPPDATGGQEPSPAGPAETSTKQDPGQPSQPLRPLGGLRDTTHWEPLLTQPLKPPPRPLGVPIPLTPRPKLGPESALVLIKPLIN